jgi:hypothetical protein
MRYNRAILNNHEVWNKNTSLTLSWKEMNKRNCYQSLKNTANDKLKANTGKNFIEKRRRTVLGILPVILSIFDLVHDKN